MKKISLAATILSIFIASFSYALDVETHKAINAYIAQHTLNEFSLDSYLKNQLGIQSGINELFDSGSLWTNSERAWEWLRDGGEFEDIPPMYLPYLRSVNHFHNPVAPTLNAAGFTGIWDTYFLAGTSAIWWSQLRLGTQTIDTPLSGNYSWFDVRDYFYKALTSSDTTTRSKNFAATFRGLGQLMHLVEDMSVPEHARNDGHYTDAYEEWVKETQRDPQRRAIFDTALANPIFFNMTALGQPSVFGTQAPVPIANLFDTNQYDGSNPGITLSPNIGLAEYTNANFVSPDSLFRGFPYPSKETSVKIEEREIPDIFNPGSFVKRKYYIKRSDGETNGALGYRLAGVNYFTFYKPNNNPVQPQIKHIPPMDSYVYEDYAKLLLPRAVGYSARLLNYFFRGEIEISLPDDGVYAITGPGGEFTKIKLKAKNITANGEEMTGGTLQLVIKYKTAIADPFHTQTDCVKTTSEFSYIVAYALSNISSLSTGTPTSLTFKLDPGIPLEATDVYLQVVYKGKLGNEEDAVAVGFKDISEPTPEDIINSMDYICQNGENVLKVNPETMTNVYLAFTPTQYASSTNYSAKFASIPAGYYGRVFILSDAKDVFYYSHKRDGYPHTYMFSWEGVRIQTDIINGVTGCAYPRYGTERGLDWWDYVGYYNNQNPICPPTEDAPLIPLIGPVPVVIPQ